MVQIEQWLWQLRDELKKLQELGLLLKTIGCFQPRPLLLSVARARSSVTSTDLEGSSRDATVGGEKENHTITRDLASTRPEEVTATSRVAPAVNGPGGSEHGALIDFRPMENQVQEALKSLEFHLAVLQRSVDQAHINMRVASQEFSSLLKKVPNVLMVKGYVFWWLTSRIQCSDSMKTCDECQLALATVSLPAAR